MKKAFILLLITVFIASFSFAQQWVSVVPENKNALVESFTGVQCGGCPAGEAELEQMLQGYGHSLSVAAYHHPNTLFCVPYGNDEDLRRPFLAAYTTSSFNFTGAYPTAFINRRMWPGQVNRNVMSSDWPQYVQAILSEPSPLNIGMNPNYDPLTKLLSVDVEVYFTATVTDPLTVYVQFTESGMVTIQKINMDLDSNYTHRHVFKEALCAQWGDPISLTTQGTLFTDAYSFDNSIKQYDMSECEVLVFVRNASTEEIITNERKSVGFSTSINKIENNALNVYPNPFQRYVTVNAENISTNLKVFDLAGRDVTSEIKFDLSDKQKLILDFSNLPDHTIYFLKSREKTFKLIRN